MFRRPPRSTLFPYTTLFRSEKIQLAKPAAARLGAGDVFDLREQMRDGCLVRAAGEAEENFVGILQAKGDDVAILQLTALHFFAIDEQPAALPAILNVKAVGFDDDGRAIARNAPVGKLQMVASLRAPPNQKRRLRHADIAPRAVRRDDFENGILAWENSFRHG